MKNADLQKELKELLEDSISKTLKSQDVLDLITNTVLNNIVNAKKNNAN